MDRKPTERLVLVGALVAGAIASLISLVVDGEAEVMLLMVCAMITGLVCFDRSLERRLRSFGPWLLISVAPILKSVPAVWLQINEDSGLAHLRYLQSGSMLFGACLLAAMVLLVRGPARSGSDSDAGRRMNVALVLATAATGAVAGSSVAYRFEDGFGTERAARLIETPTWAIVAALLVAVPLAASAQTVIRRSLVGVLVAASATAGLMAYEVAGHTVDLGAWTIIFWVLAASSTALGPGALGTRDERTRKSNAGAVLAVLVGIVTAGAAIAARSDRLAWSQSWGLLGLLALGFFAAALAAAEEPDESENADAPATRTAAPISNASSSPADGPPPQAPEPAPVPQPAGPAPTPVAVEESSPKPHAPQPAAVAQSLSDRDTLTSARATHEARAARVAAAPERTNVHPATASGRSPAHHYDPSTGLLSTAGLHELLATCFADPPDLAEVTIVLFAIRDLDEIEVEHGRLSSAAITREVASQLSALLPSGTAARFSRSAYAVVFEDNDATPDAAIERYAYVLRQLRSAANSSTDVDMIDVVAGMAQSYAGEEATHFVQRANRGLARAVQNPEPSLVAMP